MNVPLGKTCTTCNEVKPASLEFFHKQKGGKDGFRIVCKLCSNVKQREYNNVNREKISKDCKIYYKANKDYIATYIKKWRAVNREKVSSYNKNWSNKNPVKVSANKRNYRARKAKAEGSHTVEDVSNIISKQKNLCFWCNTELEEIHIDHLIPLIKGGKNDANNLVASCPSCNCSKGSKLPEEFLAYKQQQIKTHTIKT